MSAPEAPGALLADPVLSVGGLLRQRARQHPDRLAVRVGTEGATFAELDRRSDEAAAGFAAAGVERGDRVAVLAPNRLEFVEVIFGLAKAGAIQVPLNAFLKGTFLHHQLAQSGASVLVADGPGLAAATPLLVELPHLRLLVALDDPPTEPPGPVPVQSYRQLKTGAGKVPPVEVGPGDPMSIAYTSGTTGMPKGCILSHGYYQNAAAMISRYGLELTDDDVIYTALPLFHAGAQLQGLMSGLVAGIPVHFDVAFSPATLLARLTEVDATVFSGVALMALALLAMPESEADRGHRLHTMLTAPMAPADQLRVEERFGVYAWTGMYGQSERVPVTVTPRGTGHDRAGCGKAAPDLEVALLDDNLHEVPDGQVGEMCVRPRRPFAMFDGYWDQPEATLEAFRGLWYHTGDAARKLPSGEFVFVDRVKDALRRRGENVSSIELEAAIRAHPKVADVAVHAVPSPVGEDDIKACIVLVIGEKTDPKELFDYFRATLPYFALPRYVAVVDDLPRNALNRVMKHVLRERPMSADVWDFDALGLKVAKDERRARS